MPNKRRAPSRTVDLTGFTLAELRAIVFAGWSAERFGELPDAAVPALVRLNGVCRNVEHRQQDGRADSSPTEVETVSKLRRPALQSLADAVRPRVGRIADGMPELATGFAKLEQRLAARPGRPVLSALWQERAGRVAAARRKLTRGRRQAPSDADVAYALGMRPEVLRGWRHRHPDLFTRD
jgi:hypothetical protein